MAEPQLDVVGCAAVATLGDVHVALGSLTRPGSRSHAPPPWPANSILINESIGTRCRNLDVSSPPDSARVGGAVIERQGRID